MTVKLSPLFNDQQETSAGVPAVGTLLYTYAAGSSTLQATYTSSTGLVAQTNPVVFDSLGFPTGGEIWLTSGLTYKFVWKTAAGVTLKTVDNVSGVNDTTVATDEWSDTGLAPTYVSTTSYTVAGDQTSALHIGRRQKFTVTAGTVYGRITNSVYNGTTLTTLTIQMDGSQVLDSGLSAVANSNLRANVLSLPVRAATSSGTDTYTATTGIVRYVKDDQYQIKIANPNSSTTPTLNLDSLGAKTIINADGSALLPGALNGEHTFRYNGTNMVALNSLPSQFRSYLSGLTLSTAGSSATMSIAAGVAADATNSVLMTLAAAISKTTSAWAVGTGNGGIDTGSIATSTWYHFYLIKRVDTGVVDVVFSTSASAPTLPTNYTLYRRIGSGKTNGSSQWTAFTQNGDEFLWLTPIEDVNSGAINTTPTLSTLTVPTGVKVNAIVGGYCNDESTAQVAIYSPDATAGSVGGGVSGIAPANYGTLAGPAVRTNTSAQVNVYSNQASTTVVLRTAGWIDRRGRDA